jgi:archaellum component FlaC
LKLEELVQRLTSECSKSKDDVMIGELKIQEMQFEVQDLREQIKQLEKKDAY